MEVRFISGAMQNKSMQMDSMRGETETQICRLRAGILQRGKLGKHLRDEKDKERISADDSSHRQFRLLDDLQGLFRPRSNVALEGIWYPEDWVFKIDFRFHNVTKLINSF